MATHDAQHPDRRLAAGAMPLPEGEVHVHVLDVAALDVARVAPLLTPAEASRAFRFDRDRRAFVATRALARGVLAGYLGRAPDALAFVRTSRGRPVLEDAGDLRFNLSNTFARVVCAVTRGRDVGIDTEPLSRAGEILAVRTSVFRDAELDSLERQAGDERLRRAVAMWTGKEAYMKARGLGLALAPLSFALRFDGDAPTLDLPEVGDDVPSRWALSTHVDATHCTTLCVERHRGAPRVVFSDADADALASRAQKVPRTPAP